MIDYEIFGTLREDVSACLAEIDNNDSQFSRRNYIRAVFAFFEGTIFLFKQVTIDQATANKLELPMATRAMLLGESYDLDKDAKPLTHRLDLRLDKNLKFMFETMAGLFGGNLTIETDALANFRKAMKIRNRLTHPKKNVDVLVSDAELIVVKQAAQWFDSLLSVDFPNMS